MTKLHQDDVRSKIQCSQLINVLTDHALGKTEELSSTRIKAIEILLRKSLADLSAVELSGALSIAAREMTNDELTRIAGGRGA